MDSQEYKKLGLKNLEITNYDNQLKVRVSQCAPQKYNNGEITFFSYMNHNFPIKSLSDLEGELHSRALKFYEAMMEKEITDE